LGWLAVVTAFFVSRVEAQPTWTTVALTGVENEYGPQLGPGITFGSLDAFDVNSSNHFVLRGTLSAPDSFPAVGGVWSFDQERKEPIAFVGRESVTDPDMFRRVERVMLDETGTIVFEGISR
jgi:hypothetical protein